MQNKLVVQVYKWKIPVLYRNSKIKIWTNYRYKLQGLIIKKVAMNNQKFAKVWIWMRLILYNLEVVVDIVVIIVSIIIHYVKNIKNMGVLEILLWKKLSKKVIQNKNNNNKYIWHLK